MLQGGLLHLQSQVGTLVCRVSLLESGSQGRLTAVPSEIPNASRLFTAAARISCSEGRGTLLVSQARPLESPPSSPSGLCHFASLAVLGNLACASLHLFSL